MCLGGGGGGPAPPPPPPPPAPPPAPVTIQRLSKKSSRKVGKRGEIRRRGGGRRDLVIKRTTGIQYTGTGTGVNV